MEPLTWSIVRHPDFLGASSSVDDTIAWVLDHADPSLLLMGVLHIPMFSDSGAARLAALTETLLGQGGDGVGSMHNYGTDLASAGTQATHPCLAPLLAAIRESVQPIAQAVLLGADADGAMEPLVPHSQHCIGYSVTGARERALRLHVDDALVTVNVCLGMPGFEGSEVMFTGWQPLALAKLAHLQRRRAVSAEVEVAVTPRPGYALIHFGKHPHRTVPIRGGVRLNWVLWYHKGRDHDATAAATAVTTAVEPAEPVGSDSRDVSRHISPDCCEL